MSELQMIVDGYLEYCQIQKRLDSKTLKAYRIDLRQFIEEMDSISFSEITTDLLEHFIASLHQKYKPKTVKRKIASLKALFHYLEYKNIIVVNPLNKMQLKFREPVILPKVIPLHLIEALLTVMYREKDAAQTEYQKMSTLRDIAVIELLFATGMRISELCSLKPTDVNLRDRNILIYGKGSKERTIQIGSDAVVSILEEYREAYKVGIESCGYFFVNKFRQRFSEQSVRTLIHRYSSLAAIELHITPHMFRHSFATYLLESDVDIRYIQKMLGHSSITVTEIYTHVTMEKQRDILMSKHPRGKLRLE